MAVAFARGTEVRINLDALRANVRLFCERVGPNIAVMAVVKADGYGHGAVPAAAAALEAGASWLGVAAAEEGVELRHAGIDAPILVLGASTPSQVEMAVGNRLDVTVFDPDTLESCRYWGRRVGTVPRVHLKVDTGMGRVGVSPEAIGEWQEKLAVPGVFWQGLMSHLAAADSDSEYTRQQLSRFLDVIEHLRRSGVPLPPTVHLANSAAALRFPGTRFNLVRVGIGLYGLPPWPAVGEPLHPVLSWTSRVTMVKPVAEGQPVGYGLTFKAPRDAVIATVGVGYADGYRRLLSNRSEVLIHGRRCPVVGRVSMDQLTVLVPDDVAAAVGDPVALIGTQGSECVGAEHLAQWAETISYEIVTGISSRVPRIYDDSDRATKRQ